MKKVFLTAATVLALGSGAAFAQGLPPGSTPPTYGSHAFTDQSHHTGTIFSKIFGRSKTSQPAGEPSNPAVKGG